MPTGDPTWECKRCGRTYYSAIQTKCTCEPTSHYNDVRDIFNEFFADYQKPKQYSSKFPPLSVSSQEDEFDKFFTELDKDMAEANRCRKEFEEEEEERKREDELNSYATRKDTLVVNLFAGPGSGKSTTAAGIFFELKTRGINCELACEYAKDLTWEQRHRTFDNQIYIFAKQHHRIHRLLGQVEVIITDSPLLLTLIYDGNKNSSLRNLALSEHNKMWTYNAFIKRLKKYNPKGRNQTEDESRILDNKIIDMLDDNNQLYETFDGNAEGKDRIVKQILRFINFF